MLVYPVTPRKPYSEALEARGGCCISLVAAPVDTGDSHPVHSGSHSISFLPVPPGLYECTPALCIGCSVLLEQVLQIKHPDKIPSMARGMIPVLGET